MRSLRALRVAVSVGALTSVLALTACSESTDSVSRDESAHARLDRETGQIITPFSEYLLFDDAAEQAVVDQSHRVYLGHCMEAAGLAFNATMAEDQVLDDRRFGLWVEDRATAYGYSDPPSTVALTWDQDAAAGGDQWQAALDRCEEEFLNDPETAAFQANNDENDFGRASELSTDAYRLAAEDPEWEAARKPWKQCLQDNDLTPPEQPEEWSAVETQQLLESDGAESSQELLRIAAIEARCNNDTSLTQRLGDLVASYEQPLIDRHEAELKPLKERKQEILQAARDYIAAKG